MGTDFRAFLYTVVMHTYIILLRGINVGGKNKVPMVALKTCLEALGFSGVTTYIASGNAIVQSRKSASVVKNLIEKNLPKYFKLDSALIKVLVLTRAQLQNIIAHKPKGFGERPAIYHYDVIFLIDMSVVEAFKVFSPKEGVDSIWKGKGVIYSQRLSAKRAQSRLGKIVGTKAYASLTIRNWNTTTKLLERISSMER